MHAASSRLITSGQCPTRTNPPRLLRFSNFALWGLPLQTARIPYGCLRILTSKQRARALFTQFGCRRHNPSPHQIIRPCPLETPVSLPMRAYRSTAICCGIHPLDTQAFSPLYSTHQKASSYHLIFGKLFISFYRVMFNGNRESCSCESTFKRRQITNDQRGFPSQMDGRNSTKNDSNTL